MSVDVLVVVGDDALRTVLEIALTVDGCVVRTAADADQARRTFSAEPPHVLIVEATMLFSGDVLALAGRTARTIPAILLVPAWIDEPAVSRADTVVLRMPFGREELRRALATAREQAPEPVEPVRVLLVDDDEAICQVIAALLNASEYLLTTCTTPDEATARLATETFDLVLADGLSQRSDVAWETAAAILRSAGSTPVVLFSAHKYDAAAALALGYRDFIQKPFDIDDLERRIRGVLAHAANGPDDNGPQPLSLHA